MLSQYLSVCTTFFTSRAMCRVQYRQFRVVIARITQYTAIVCSTLYTNSTKWAAARAKVEEVPLATVASVPLVRLPVALAVTAVALAAVVSKIQISSL